MPKRAKSTSDELSSLLRRGIGWWRWPWLGHAVLPVTVLGVVVDQAIGHVKGEEPDVVLCLGVPFAHFSSTANHSAIHGLNVTSSSRVGVP